MGGRGGHLGFPIGLKITNLVDHLDILLPLKFFLNCLPEERVSQKSKMCKAIWGLEGHLGFPIGQRKIPKPTNVVDGLRSCFLSRFVEFPSAVSEMKLKISQPIRGLGGHLVFYDGPKKHKFERGRRDLPVSFHISLDSVVSEEMSKMWKVNEGRTTDKAWSQ